MDYRLPELGEGIYEAELVAWRVQPGDSVRRGQSLAEVLTDKASMELPSSFIGVIESLKAAPGSRIKVGEVVLTYRPEAEEEAADLSQAEESREGVSSARVSGGLTPSARLGEPAMPSPVSRELREGTVIAVDTGAMRVKAAPSVRLMARQLGIDLTQIRGSGPGGRILISDLKAAIQPIQQPTAPRPAPSRQLPDFGKPGTRIKFQGVRRRIAEHMVLSKRTIPHFGYVDEADVTQLVRLRESLKEPLAERGIRLTYLAFIVKAVVGALKDVPIVNATLDEEGQEIVLHDHYHIGFAVAAPQGLLVPVVRDADRKGLFDLAREIEKLTEDVRANRIRPEDLRGGTFTVTSIGSFGGLISTPIIPHPQVGIVGVGKIVKRPVYDQNLNIVPADIVYLSFSFDHRVLDGAAATAFGNALIRRLQNPATLLL
ncbi:MAG: 2-oxo acid dehydrogenase subunit E2 [Gemmatales bacterium]|nr:2-oxo acid dehydrogenase subunit E2 [Gemmatales bacterium]MDW8385575.1 dihydrolipoamide acetyltransferase family protein [Gemmatales bacterium]